MRDLPIYLCERCSGNGGWIDYDAKDDIEFFFQCPDCTGTGINNSKKYKHATKRKRQIDRENIKSDSSNDDGDKCCT